MEEIEKIEDYRPERIVLNDVKIYSLNQLLTQIKNNNTSEKSNAGYFIYIPHSVAQKNGISTYKNKIDRAIIIPDLKRLKK